MSESRNSPASSLSIGPLDKSKALQEQDLLQDMLGDSRQSSISPVVQPFQMFKEDKSVSQLPSGMYDLPLIVIVLLTNSELLKMFQRKLYYKTVLLASNKIKIIHFLIVYYQSINLNKQEKNENILLYSITLYYSN